MHKKLFAALAIQLALALAVLLSPFGITQLVEKYGSESEFSVTEAHLYNYYIDEERCYQLDLNLKPVDGVEINRRISGTDPNGNYFSYEDSGYENPGYCTYRFKSEEAQQAFAADFDSDNYSYFFHDALKDFVRDNNVTVRIRYFYRYVIVEGVYVNGENIENYNLEKGFQDYNE
ncbi:MAG: hypothetical protein IK085_02100 [Clostridia bacterium]|nr:hypothetical protein [Clostridia bacterium]